MSLLIKRLAAGSTFQDSGRPGFRRYGVPPSGAFDGESHRLALALVGKANGATLEVPMLGGEFVALENDVLAWVGAEGRVAVDGHEVSTNSSLTVEKGAYIQIGPAQRGARLYFVSQRGWRVGQRLGSASGLEPARQLETDPAEIIGSRRPRRLASPPDSLRDRPLRIVAGPHMRESDQSDLCTARFRVGLASNRVGIRLEGGAFEQPGELASEPSCLGALQVTPSGELLVHGPDGPTIGGYPKVAVVIRADFSRLGQLRPTDEVEFVFVSLEEAREAFAMEERRLDRLVEEIRAETRGNMLV